MQVSLRLLILCTAVVLQSLISAGCGGSGGSMSGGTASSVEERTENDPTPGLKSEGKLPRQYTR
jgi:hypothetical protein